MLARRNANVYPSAVGFEGNDEADRASGLTIDAVCNNALDRGDSSLQYHLTTDASKPGELEGTCSSYLSIRPARKRLKSRQMITQL